MVPSTGIQRFPSPCALSADLSVTFRELNITGTWPPVPGREVPVSQQGPDLFLKRI